MQELTFFTPSFRGDLERFVLLRKSIKRFYHGVAQHIVVVPKEDVSLFNRELAGDNIKVLAQNDFVSSYYYPRKWYPLLKRAFPSQAWRFQTYAGRPGWVIQQIVKLSLPEKVNESVTAILDSDLFFIRPFDNSDLEVEGDKQILVRTEPTTESGKHRKYMEAARRLLGLAPGSTDHHYMAYPAIWYSDWVKKLRKHIESIHQKPWQKVLYEADMISEYLIYGIFVEEILKPENLKVRLDPFHYIIWDQNSYTRFISGEFAKKNNNKIICAVVQSNLQIPVDQYRASLETFYKINN